MCKEKNAFVQNNKNKRSDDCPLIESIYGQCTSSDTYSDRNYKINLDDFLKIPMPTKEETIGAKLKTIFKRMKEKKDMNFGEALEALKSGKRVAREGWNGKNQYLELATNVSYVNASGEVVNVDHSAMGNKAIAFVGTSGVQLGWLATQSDMLSEDWKIL